MSIDPLYYKRGIPFFADKPEAAFRADPYERYDPMVVRQTLVHLADAHWNTYPCQSVLDWTMAHLPEMLSGRVVDIGCGVGRLAGELAQRFPDSEVWGIDYSYQLLRQAQRYWQLGTPFEVDGCSRGFPVLELGGPVLPNLRLGLARAEALPFSDQSIDVVSSWFLLDRVGDPESFFREVYRVLAPEGRCVLITPFNFQQADQWRRFYPLPKLVAQLGQLGFQVQRQTDDLEVREPLDAHGNQVLWRCSGLMMNKISRIV